MGRTRKPMSEQRGNLTKEIQTRKTAEQDLIKTTSDFFQNSPDWLSERGQKEYQRLYKALKDMEMLGDLDANNLSAYCEAFDKYLIATENIGKYGIVVNFDNKVIPNPCVNLQIKYAKEMRDFGKQCGLSIDSRLKFASTKLEKIEDDINTEFGDI